MKNMALLTWKVLHLLQPFCLEIAASRLNGAGADMEPHNSDAAGEGASMQVPGIEYPPPYAMWPWPGGPSPSGDALLVKFFLASAKMWRLTVMVVSVNALQGHPIMYSYPPTGFQGYPYPFHGMMPGAPMMPQHAPAPEGKTKRRRKNKHAKAEGAPKKPATSFVMFSNAQRETVKEEHPGLNFIDVGKKLG